MDDYNVILKSGEGEYTDRKSRFIGHVMPISGEDEALALIAQIKRRYWDARHNCYGYITGERGEILKSSDDGEPGGTAGRPILDVLTGENLRNALIVVTRYFGGTLLGTGGLVRAYTKASAEAISNAVIGRMARGKKLFVTADYNTAERLRRYFENDDIIIENVEYTDKVEFKLLTCDEDYERVSLKVGEISAGKADICVTDTGYFSMPITSVADI